MINRMLTLPDYSFFLFGPRQTGKSTLINNLLSKNSKKFWTIDLLHSDTYLKYLKQPERFRKETIEKIKNEQIELIFIDEVQKLPLLLNEVHFLIENTHLTFILTGSSARKLKRGGVDMLAGRAVQRFLFPFCYQEIKDNFSIDDVLQFGSIPSVFGKEPEQKMDILNTYVETYLKEEIKAEGLTRNLAGFARFLDLASSQFGELVSFSTIAREIGISYKTVEEYYQILEDTLIGIKLLPWFKSYRKRLVNHPKFYLFDLGVTNSLNKHITNISDPFLKGRLFEQLIILETYRYLKYSRSESQLFFWRTGTGTEVDLLIEKHGKIRYGFEIKFSSNIVGAHLTGIRSFREDNPEAKTFVIYNGDEPYEINETTILPWKNYFEKLNEFIS